MSRVITAFSQFFDGQGDPLSNGWLRFLQSGTNNTAKNTYADANQTTPNANPLQLDAEGRCPNVFGQGIYRVILYQDNPVTHLPGTMIQSFDPVIADFASSGAGGNFADWDSETIYQVGQIVLYNGLYYRSFVANNVGNAPDISIDSWERIDFLRFWNSDVTYGLDEIAIYGSQIYFSLQVGNLNNVPNVSPAWWDPVASGTILLNWQESGTDFIPVINGYNLGSITNMVGDIYQENNGVHYFGSNQDAQIYYDGSSFNTLASGAFAIGAIDASPINFLINSIIQWTIDVSGNFVPSMPLDIGSTTLLAGNIYQGDNYRLYLGNDQDAYIYHTGSDFYLLTENGSLIIGTDTADQIAFYTNSTNHWNMEITGNFIPTIDNTYDLGSATYNLRSVYIGTAPATGDEATNKTYVDPDYTPVYYNPDGTETKPIDQHLSGIDSRLFSLSGFKNKIINGKLSYWIRGTSQSVTGYKSVDRFTCGIYESTATFSRQSFTPGQTDVPGEPEYYARMAFTTAGTTTSAITLIHKIKSVRTFAGENAILSFWAKAATSMNMAVEFSQFIGTGGTPSGGGNGIGVTTIALTTNWQAFNVPVSLPSLSGSTIGTDLNDSLRIYFWFEGGSNFDARNNSLGNQSGTIDIALIQFELGSIATDFEERPTELEIVLCQHYYWSKDYVTLSGDANARVANQVIFPTKMRTVPTITLSNIASGTGGAFGLVLPDGCYQTSVHSANSTCKFSAEAEL